MTNRIKVMLFGIVLAGVATSAQASTCAKVPIANAICRHLLPPYECRPAIWVCSCHACAPTCQNVLEWRVVYDAYCPAPPQFPIIDPIVP